MKSIVYENLEFNNLMTLYEIRKKLFDYYKNILSDKIRVFSLVYKWTKIICEKLEIKFEWYFLAIWELNHKSFSRNIQELWWFLKQTKIYDELKNRKEKLIKELDKRNISIYQYDLTWAWYEYLRKLLSKQEYNLTWIKYDYKNWNNEVFVVNWASFWLKSVFEMLYRKLDRKVKTIFPVPMFTLVLDTSDIFLDTIILETEEKNNFKVTKKDILISVEETKKYIPWVKLLYANWLDWVEKEWLKVEQDLEKNIFSNFIPRNSLVLENINWDSKIIDRDFLEKNYIDWLVLDFISKKIYLDSEKLTSKELHSQNTTIEILEILLKNLWKEVSNKDLPRSSYSTNKNEMIWKIIWPLTKLIEKRKKVKLNLECKWSLSKFYLKLSKNNKIDISIIRKII